MRGENEGQRAGRGRKTERWGERLWKNMKGLGKGRDERKRMEGRKWESDREAVEQIKVKLSAFTYLDERF